MTISRRATLQRLAGALGLAGLWGGLGLPAAGADPAIPSARRAGRRRPRGRRRSARGGLRHHPRPGEVLMCDFTGGVAPEITKRRPVVVVGPRLPGRSRLYAVVPLSGARPRVARAYHVRLPSNPHPGEADARPVWAKCDLLQNVSIDRLDRFRLGAGRYTAARRLDAETLEAVRAGMLAALGLAEGRST